MKSLTSPVSTTIASDQLQTALLFDFYLKDAIATPYGTTNTIRITKRPGGLAFFTPQVAPEPSGTRGNAATYLAWPIEKGSIETAITNTNDQITITVTNVSKDYATMLNLEDWRDVPVVIRLVCPGSSLTADDCAIDFIGNIDEAIVTGEAIQFTCSNDLAGFDLKIPRENFHRNCRFAWGDDMCGAIRLAPENYKASKTVGTSSTTTVVNSSDLTEDTWGRFDSPTDEVDALADASIVGSDYSNKYTNQAVTINHLANPANFNLAASTLAVGDLVKFSATTFPNLVGGGSLSGAVWYYVRAIGASTFNIAATPAGTVIKFTTDGSGIQLTTGATGNAYVVKSSNGGSWLTTPDSAWADYDEGYWDIKDAQAGLANAALVPFITFDFGSAKTLKTWRIKHSSDIDRERLLRLVMLFSSPDNSTWTLERYFELPPISDFFEIPIHAASNRRYWRLSVRSRWTDTNFASSIECINAYVIGRNYFTHGFIKFAANTTTVALRGIRRAIVASWNLSLDVAALPVVPVNGDTFSIERGCPRTFNGCSERLNQAHFGGFDSIPFETIVR